MQPATFNLQPATHRIRDPGEDFEQSRFAGPVRANDAQNLAFLDFERDVFECPEGIFVGHGGETVFEIAEGGEGGVFGRFAGGGGAFDLVAEAVAFAEGFDCDGGGHDFFLE
jgi:hypothetical protein